MERFFFEESEKEYFLEFFFKILGFDKNKFNTPGHESGKLDSSFEGETMLSVEDKSVCRYCAKHFIEPHSRRKHEIEMHENKDKYVCETCEMEFNTVNGLKAHIHNKHTMSEENFPCDEPKCDKQYSSLSALKRHCQNEGHKFPHDASSSAHEYDAKCEVCGKLIGTKWMQNKHLCALDAPAK